MACFRKVFDSWWFYRFYDLIVKVSCLGREGNLRNIVVEAFEKSPKRLIDLGTGTGEVAIAINERFPRVSVTGIDASAKILAGAEKKSRKLGIGINFVKADFCKTMLSSRSFDAAAMSLALHEVSHSERLLALREANRLLKNRGTFVILEFHRPKSILFRLLLKLQFLMFEEEFSRGILKENLPSELRNAGFKVISKDLYYDGALQRIIAKKLAAKGAVAAK